MYRHQTPVQIKLQLDLSADWFTASTHLIIFYYVTYIEGTNNYYSAFV